MTGISRSRKRIAHLSNAVCLVLLNFMLCSATWAQANGPAPAPGATQSELPKDSLGRTTPRGTVLAFLSAARNGDDELAVRYLNTHLHGKGAAVLAHNLFTILDRRLPPRLNQLSDAPEGSLSNLLHPDQETVGTIESANGDVDIVLERTEQGQSGFVWLFSRKTLDLIPDLYDEINVVSIENILPDALVSTRFIRIPLYEWLAVIVGVPLIYYLTALLNRLLSRVIGALRRSWYRKPDLRNSEILPQPVRLLLLALVVHSITSRAGLPLLARQMWSGSAAVITIAASAWLLILFSGWSEKYFRSRLLGSNRTGTAAVLHLARRLVDVLIVLAALAVTLRLFRANATVTLTGLGVGGVAVALAAQKTLENVIGGVSLIFDQAVRVGDIIRVAATQGIVEEIGMRSTRIRTLERTVVSVPNGQIANMTLENISSRDKFWFHPTLPLRYGTTSPQMRTVLLGVRSLLEESRQVEPASVCVRFLCFGPSSLEVEALAYILARDKLHFLEIQESLLLRIMDCIEATGTQLSFPTQSILAPGTANGMPLTPRQTGLQP
jgi:MscS family membrane protein